MEWVPRSWERPLWQSQILVSVFMGSSTFIPLPVWWEGKGMDHFSLGKGFSLPFHSCFITCTFLRWHQKQGKEKRVSPCNSLCLFSDGFHPEGYPHCFCCYFIFTQSKSPVWLLLDFMDYSQPGSFHGISQAGILEGVVLSCSRVSSPPWDRTCISCVGRCIPYHWATREASYCYLGELKRPDQSSPRKKQQTILNCVTFYTKQQSKLLCNLLGQSIWYLSSNWSLPKWSSLNIWICLMCLMCLICLISETIFTNYKGAF